MLAVNVAAAFRCARAALPSMLEQGWGRIVNIASIAGLRGYAYVTAYCTAKHALVGFTRALAAETITGGITVNAVCPGYVDTDMVRKAASNIAAKTGRSTEQAKEEIVRSNPQGRLIGPDEVADTVAWLCGNDARSVTGHCVAMGGGEGT
jgi:NAD(P)-dependent dehydrogenase (short-subunit alcohol dehydrogenase family)